MYLKIFLTELYLELLILHSYHKGTEGLLKLGHEFSLNHPNEAVFENITVGNSKIIKILNTWLIPKNYFKIAHLGFGHKSV